MAKARAEGGGGAALGRYTYEANVSYREWVGWKIS